MCGLAGWLDPGTDRSADELEGMTRALSHRGPDDAGRLLDGPVALGHRRLSIIDLSEAGRQPMLGEDGSQALVFNGEIYNFASLRGELGARGHRFTSRTDCEVVLHGHEEWAEGVLERLAGMFAFAIWDARARRLRLARDPFGIKPLYYWWAPEGGLYFASEIRAFRALSGFQPRPHLPAIAQYLAFDFGYDPHRTAVDGVFRLPAGHLLDVSVEDVAARRRPRPRAYYRAPQPEPFGGGAAEIELRLDRLRAALDEAVAQHLVADVPVALLLSGGLDSSLVGALAARRAGGLRTLTMGFADSKVDEREQAREVSEAIGSEHQELLIRPEELAAELPEAVAHVDDLFGDWGVVTTHLLYRRCKEAGIKVILVGEGSDELFAGYPSHALAPRAARGPGAWRGALRLFRWYSGRRWGREMFPFARLLRQLADERGGDGFEAVRLFETRHQLPHRYNLKVDRASMAASVEARVPFQDVRVAAEAFRTPRELLLRDGANKYLLRRLALRDGLLPRHVALRPKFGAGIAASWLAESPAFRDQARSVVLEPGGWAARLGLRDDMERYFRDGASGRPFPHPVGIFSILAWRLLMLELWSRHQLSGGANP